MALVCALMLFQHLPVKDGPLQEPNSVRYYFDSSNFVAKFGDLRRHL